MGLKPSAHIPGRCSLFVVYLAPHGLWMGQIFDHTFSSFDFLPPLTDHILHLLGSEFSVRCQQQFTAVFPCGTRSRSFQGHLRNQIPSGRKEGQPLV